MISDARLVEWQCPILGHKRRCELLVEALFDRGHEVGQNVDSPDLLVVDYPEDQSLEPVDETPGCLWERCPKAARPNRRYGIDLRGKVGSKMRFTRRDFFKLFASLSLALGVQRLPITVSKPGQAVENQDYDPHESVIRSNLSYIHQSYPYIGEALRRGSWTYMSHDILAPSFGEGVRKG